MTRPKIITLVGTRPELIKLSPVIPLFDALFEHQLIHSGQHYSFSMDAIFFEELRLPAPAYRLEVGSGSHAAQTARILERLEPALQAEQPSAVVVLGDTNTTLAGALTATKLHIPCVHLEAGCRSFNRAMPEEINRILTDHMAELLCAPGERERSHLQAEGIPAGSIHVVGSTAIDACLRNRDLAASRTLIPQLGLDPGSYILLTLHRAENTTPDVLRSILGAINALAERWDVVFPIHPRTREVLASLQREAPAFGLHPKIHVIDPVGYLDMLHLVVRSHAVMTDSGGLQEETAVLGKPLLVLRQETEWTYLVDAGAAFLVGNAGDTILETALPLLRQGQCAFKTADVAAQCGAAQRIADVLAAKIGG
ncbi:MAG: UDP-N-acetylglucosamine 2-epimerase (non-hydrolyzing) [Anaerolineae bacterium]|nr:UDP-N-acetylglucosamine 2-epimerase (non-hydrolyzing) [Anaerolineae bacterium]